MKLMKSRAGGGQVVIVRAVYSDAPSSNPAKVYQLLFCGLFR